jgi:hypothetical protein
MTWHPSTARALLWICSSLVNNLTQNLSTVFSKSFHHQNGATKRDSVLELSGNFIFLGTLTFFFYFRGHFDVFSTSSGHDKGPTTDWIVGFYCSKVPLSIGTTLKRWNEYFPKPLFNPGVQITL